MNTRAFTLVEFLIVLGILGILLGLGVLGLINLMHSSTVEHAGQTVAQQFALAKNAVRRHNKDVTVTIDTAAKTVTVTRDGTALSTATLGAVDVAVACRESNVTEPCPVGNAFVLHAPHGTLAQDIRVDVERGTHKRSSYILGPVMVVVRR